MAAEKDNKLHDKKPPEKVPIPKPSSGWEGPPALVVVGGSGLTIGSRLNLKPGATVLGRSPDADIPILDNSMSRQHVEILLTDAGDCVVTDLKSRHGSFVNDSPLREPRSLVDGDYLRCGNVNLKFRIAKDMPAKKPEAKAVEDAPAQKASGPLAVEEEPRSDRRPSAPRPAAKRAETTARGGQKVKPPAPPAEESTVPIPPKK